MTPSIALPLLIALGRAAAPAPVHYAVKVVTRSWEPLDLTEVERMIEAKALAPLTAIGTMSLSRSAYAELKDADYALTIDGRFIEEAEKFSVYLTFGPARKNAVPSFHVSDTEAVGGLERAVMQQKIEALAARAGQRLAGVLRPWLDGTNADRVRGLMVRPELPWTWGPIEVPSVRSPSKLIETLIDVEHEDHERAQALAGLEGHVFDQPPARDAVVLCTLRDPSPRMRADCARALAPVARAHTPTQRILLLAMRQELDEGALEALTSLAQTFVGLSRKESIETWLELVASEATPGQAVAHVAGLLAEERDVPNLDLAVARCLQAESLAEGKKYPCADVLLRAIPAPRRALVATPYLAALASQGGGDRNEFERVRENVVGNGSDPIDPALAELFLRIAERPAAGDLRGLAIDVAARHRDPTPAIARRFIRLVEEPRLTRWAAQGLQALVRRNPTLTPVAIEGLRKLRDQGHFIPQKLSEHPRATIADALERLERLEADAARH